MGDLRGQVGGAAGDGADAGDELAGVAGFEEEAAGSAGQGAGDVLVLAEGGQDDDGGGGAAQFAGGGQDGEPGALQPPGRLPGRGGDIMPVAAERARAAYSRTSLTSAPRVGRRAAARSADGRSARTAPVAAPVAAGRAVARARGRVPGAAEAFTGPALLAGELRCYCRKSGVPPG